MILAKQPILDARGELYGYEILNRSGSENPTLEVVYTLVSRSDLYEAVPLFINVDEGALRQSQLDLLPKERVVLEIARDVDLAQEQLRQRLEALKRSGYRLALDGFVVQASVVEAYEPFWRFFDVVKVDVSNKIEGSSIESLVRTLHAKKIKLVALKVESVDSFVELKGMGFDLFQGYYFAKPIEEERPKVEANRFKILELISALNAGKSPQELEESIKEDPQLTLELLQFINSPYFMIKHEIDSIKRAIMMIGLKKFKQWLYLLLYASGSSNLAHNPLFQLVLQRANLMAKLARELEGVDEEKAFLTGVLSAADVLMKMPMAKLLERFKIDPEVKEALLQKSNIYGKLLLLVMANEVGNKGALERLLLELGITQERFAEAILETM